jgi:hypothetical protein
MKYDIRYFNMMFWKQGKRNRKNGKQMKMRRKKNKKRMRIRGREDE